MGVTQPEWDPFLGLATLRPAAGFGFVKGRLFSARPWFVRERWGDAALQRLCRDLPPETVALVESPPALTAWVDYDALAAFDITMAKQLMADPRELEDFGAAIAERDLSSVYSNVLTLVTSYSFLLRRINSIYRLYFRGGSRLRTEISGDTARVTLSGDALPRYQCQHGVVGWWHATAKKYGIADPRVEHTSCMHDGDERCEWSLNVR